MRHNNILISVAMSSLLVLPAVAHDIMDELERMPDVVLKNLCALKSICNPATGPTGPTGPIGPNGSAGAQGAPGLPGATGVTGVAGAQGPTGIIGPCCATSQVGVTGATGVAGPTGAIGAFGATVSGPTGPAGAPGITGPAGAIGPCCTGAMGAGGAAGISTPIPSNQSVQLGAEPGTVAAGQPFIYTTPELTTAGITAITGVFSPPFSATGTIFMLANIGKYEVNYQMVYAQDGGVILYQGQTVAGMLPLPYTMIGKTVNGQVKGSVIVVTTTVNSFIAVVAAAGNTAALTIAGDSSTTNLNATTVSIKQIA